MELYADLLTMRQLDWGWFYLTSLNYLSEFQSINPSPIPGLIMTKSQFDDME